MGRLLIAIAIAMGLAGCGGARPAPAAASDEGTRAREPDAASTRAADAEPRPSRVRVRVIFVSLAERTPESGEERARMLARTARADDFSQLAVEYGDGEDRAGLGGAGLVLEQGDARVPPAVIDAALALRVREISEPVRAGDGFWVLQRVE